MPIPEQRVHPILGLTVIALHVGLLWLVQLYWPLQGHASGLMPRVIVQIFQSSVAAKRVDVGATSHTAPSAGHAPSSLGISGQHWRSSVAPLDTPAAASELLAVEQSTPLAASAQTAFEQTSHAPLRKLSEPVPVQAAASSLPERVPESPLSVQAAPLSGVQDAKLTHTPQIPVALSITAPLAAPEPAPAATPPAETVSPVVSPPMSALLTPAIAAVPTPVPLLPETAVATHPIVAPLMAAPENAAAKGSGATAAGPSTAGPSSGAVAAPSSDAVIAGPLGPPFDMRVSPPYPYRPPMFVPQRSLSDMANAQLRRKPRDPFAEAVDRAANSDCVRDRPDGPAQGLLAIGPLLKRALEEKCKK